MALAIQHEGFSFVDVLQPCVSFNNTYKRYNELVEVLEEIPETSEHAFAVARKTEPLLLGILCEVKKPPFHKALYEDWNPIAKRTPKGERRERVAALLRPKAS
jgi:2-oxoglutarate ferredoxin oxidoreductase subunit beta